MGDGISGISPYWLFALSISSMDLYLSSSTGDAFLAFIEAIIVITSIIAIDGSIEFVAPRILAGAVIAHWAYDAISEWGLSVIASIGIPSFLQRFAVRTVGNP